MYLKNSNKTFILVGFVIVRPLVGFLGNLQKVDSEEIKLKSQTLSRYRLQKLGVLAASSGRASPRERRCLDDRLFFRGGGGGGWGGPAGFRV